MKILWHSAAPWEPTGYGSQTAIWTKYLRDAGHDVALSARSGLQYNIGEYEGMPVFPAPPLQGEGVADDMLPGHVDQWKPDLIIVLYDMWHFSMPPARLPNVPIAFWHPVDCHPLDAKERAYLASGRVYPVAMSHHGQRELQAAGFECGYVPHGIDTGQTFIPPPEDRSEIRKAFEIPDGAFVIGMNATSTDAVRKGIAEQLQAFAEFRTRHKNAILMCHSLPNFSLGADILAMMGTLRLPQEALRFPPVYRYLMGAIPAESMATWYGALDVLTNCTYGEGFGLAAIESQACGTPVILSRGTTGKQLVGPGWLVDTQPWWNATHRAWWHAPDIASIVRCYEQARLDAGNRRKKAWVFAGEYSIPEVGKRWDAVLRAAVGDES